jgi:hypothetical protein
MDEIEKSFSGTRRGSPGRCMVVAVTFAVLLSGCGGSLYHRLRSENDFPELKALSARYPAEAKYVTCRASCGHQHRLAVREMGPRDPETLIVVIHGVLSDSRSWRFLAGDLSRDHAILLIDLPGCGKSEGPDPDSVKRDFYSPTGMSRCVLSLIREKLKEHPPSARLIVMGHSLGGMVVLRMPGSPKNWEEFADVVGRVDRAHPLGPGG